MVTGLAGVLLLTMSTVAMASHLLEAQRVKASAEIHDGYKYTTAKAAYDKAEAVLKRLADVRSAEEIKASLEAAPVPRSVFVKTKECTDVTLDASMEACKPVTALRIELASALRKRELEAEVPKLKADVDKLPKPLEPTYAETLAASSWSWLLGIATVIIATFGAVICAKAEPVPAANDNRRLAPTSTDLDLPPPTGSDEPTKRRPELQVVAKVERPAANSNASTASATRFAQIEEFVEGFRSEHGRDPSFSETRDALHLPGATVSKYLARVLAA